MTDVQKPWCVVEDGAIIAEFTTKKVAYAEGMHLRRLGRSVFVFSRADWNKYMVNLPRRPVPKEDHVITEWPKGFRGFL